MPQRLTERFPLGTAVDICFKDADQWRAGVIVHHDPPGVWVQTRTGQRWFVTNGRRIRAHNSGGETANAPNT